VERIILVGLVIIVASEIRYTGWLKEGTECQGLKQHEHERAVKEVPSWDSSKKASDNWGCWSWGTA
jgi:hypothetical protein